MTANTFLALLFAFATLSALVTEGIKNFIKDKENISYNLIALIVALIVGGVGTAVYYQLNDIAFTLNNIIYLVLMGLASGLGSMVEFDKVKQLVEQITGINYTNNQ